MDSPMFHTLLLSVLTAIILTVRFDPALAQPNTTCPLDFRVLRDLLDSTSLPTRNMSTSLTCQYARQGLWLVESQYLQRTYSFVPPLASAESCWQTYQTLANQFYRGFDIRSKCGFQTSWISRGCLNITTKSQFELRIPKATLEDVVSTCTNYSCATCTSKLSDVQALHLKDSSIENVTDCRAYPFIYAAAFASRSGPISRDTANCLFLLDLPPKKSGKKKKKGLILGVTLGCFAVLLVVGSGCWWYFSRDDYRRKRRRRREGIGRSQTDLDSGLGSISQSSTLVKFTFDQILEATGNFSRDNIIGKGGFGNVYKGELPDGSEVALKRFKNCSAAGDADFAHEVEVIASVRHVNLLTLRGYCIATTPSEGHQRIIVCDLVKNGSLYDHLFGSVGEKLVWPIRQKIALGTARGLAYLHYGAQPAIIHRDIKASNILLDESCEPQLADFGLAKFAPEGMTHLSTRVAGTMGYVAPEYALYGQLTERSDVYSFGVVLLELLSGRKALLMNDQNEPHLLADWAWSLVKEGRALDVIDEGIPEMGPHETMEKYVLVAVLCSHPQLYARPTMDQVVKMLETDTSIPSIPDRPIPVVSKIDDIEKSMSSNDSGMSLVLPALDDIHAMGK